MPVDTTKRINMGGAQFYMQVFEMVKAMLKGKLIQLRAHPVQQGAYNIFRLMTLGQNFSPELNDKIWEQTELTRLIDVSMPECHMEFIDSLGECVLVDGLPIPFSYQHQEIAERMNGRR